MDRVKTISRRSWLLAGLGLSLSRVKAVERLAIVWEGDDLRVAAPQLHFLTGKPMERLKDGSSVVFLTQLTLSVDDVSNVLRRTPERFVFSYDLWEEKFS